MQNLHCRYIAFLVMSSQTVCTGKLTFPETHLKAQVHFTVRDGTDHCTFHELAETHAVLDNLSKTNPRTSARWRAAVAAMPKCGFTITAGQLKSRVDNPALVRRSRPSSGNAGH
ncbi:hypothetical protein DVH05_001846 [Phytophthora capsici]|nr:hypothetical protein DVH05_001846 [Phytophthora capsici]